VNIPTLLRRRPRVTIVAFTATVLVMVAVLLTADLWWRRDQAIDVSQTRTRSLVVVLAEYLHGSFAAADAALRQVVLYSPRVGGPTGPNEIWDPLLASARAGLVAFGGLSVTDRNGTITHSTVKPIVGASRRDTGLFKELAAGTRDELTVDRPFPTVTAPQQFVIPIGRRLTDARGAFDGTVVASMIPDSFREFFRTIDLGPGGIITVLHPDGVVLFREPSTRNPINESAGDNTVLERARRAGTGAFVGPLQPGGPAFVTAYQTTASPPLIVSVSLPETAVLAEWQRQRRVSLTAFGALFVTLTGLVLLLFRVVTARERAERELADVQRQEAERLRVANDRLAEALQREQQARKQVEEASYMKDEFLMTVSHELRTPLTAIYGWVRVLAGREMPRAEQSKALASIERNALAQTRLIDDLLDVSRVIAGKLRLESRMVDIAAVVRAAADTHAPAAAAKGLTLEVHADPSLEPIPADPDRLQQIVWNLLSNAIKFTPEGGRIDVRAGRADDSHVEILVCDSGVGIAPDFLPYVFERFRQGEAGTKRRYGGLGLGLAIARHLVELHGGTVGVHSAGEGRGTTFRVLLPSRERRGREMPAPASLARTAAGLAPDRLDRVRALVVDDERDARDLFAQVLESAGARVRTAASADEALTCLIEEGTDVLLSDIEMPQMDGYELLRLVLADSRIQQRGLVAIALTAYSRTADRRRALEAGFHEHLPKPVDPETLVATIAALRRRAAPE
jgi:signal transduction histidine kinase/ActR/RegA family two-component response regulator